MSFASKWFVLFLSIVAALGADKEKQFQAGPAASYPCRQTIEKVTIAADAFDKQEKTSQAFGKLNPNRYGILPVLVVIQNDSPAALTLETMRVAYIMDSRQKIEATPAREVPYARGPKQPSVYKSPLPRLPGTSSSKNPLSAWEIEGRAFLAKMLPPGQSASGFFYFQAPHLSGSVLYITGIQEAGSRRELFYFEIPLDR
jgi:hypothetical protein